MPPVVGRLTGFWVSLFEQESSTTGQELLVAWITADDGCLLCA